MAFNRTCLFVFEVDENVDFDLARQYVLDNYDISPRSLLSDIQEGTLSLIIEDPVEYNLRQLTELAENQLFVDYEIDTERNSDLKKWELHMPRNDDGQIDVLWHHKAVNFPQAIEKLINDEKLDVTLGHAATDISVFQLDTGYSDHERLKDYPGYNTGLSKSFIETDMNKTGKDSLKRHIQGIAHATSTAFTFIGTPPGEEGSISNADENHRRFSKKLARGLFPYVRFVPLRVARSVFFNLNLIENSPKDLYEAVRYAIDNGADILVLSMGGEGMNKHYKMAADLAYEKGVLFVCASGSVIDAVSGVIRPASEPNTIGVAGITTRRVGDTVRYIPLPEGCDGRSIDISAPAKWVYTAGKSERHGDYYRLGIGSSQSAVHVAAAGAVWLQYWKDVLRFDPFFTQKKSNMVDAFKWALDKSKFVPAYWQSQRAYIEENKGILDAFHLLDYSPLDFKDLPR